MGTEGTKNLKLDVLNLQNLPEPYATSLFTAGNTWVIQTDKGKCWQSTWSLVQQESRQARTWKVEYRERDNIPVIGDFRTVQSAYQDLEGCLAEAQDFSRRRKFGWKKWFEKAMLLMHDPSPVLPFFADLLPSTFITIKVRQLFAGTLKACVFGGLGSWNDVYISDSAVEKEYQQISKSLYGAVMQSIVSVTNSTADFQTSQLSIS